MLQINRMWGKVGDSGDKNAEKVGEWGMVVVGGTGRTVHRLEFLTKISKNKLICVSTDVDFNIFF